VLVVLNLELTFLNFHQEFVFESLQLVDLVLELGRYLLNLLNKYLLLDAVDELHFLL